MPFFIKDDIKSEAVNPTSEQALRDPGSKQDYVDRAVAWSKAFNARTKPNEIDLDETAFLDSLYED